MTKVRSFSPKALRRHLGSIEEEAEKKERKKDSLHNKQKGQPE